MTSSATGVKFFIARIAVALQFAIVLGLVTWAFVVAGFWWQGILILILWKTLMWTVKKQKNDEKDLLVELVELNNRCASSLAEGDQVLEYVKDARCEVCGHKKVEQRL